MNNLRIIREEQSFTKKDLANAVGVTERYISFIEQGTRTPSLDIASKIANIFLSSNCTKNTFNNKSKSKEKSA
ncbi:helix-turn-helix transcriptional regulator [Pectinatus sottacetonis]|uniref:helix-turn-helix transcriptional regulator n=1 Tax=Pectinatus sottacetonis TaxID=1002795 RepID=UPI0018C8530D